MFSSEVRDTVMIAVTMILLSVVLSFASYLMLVRGQYAEVRNNEVYVHQKLSDEKELNRFNEDAYGVDIIAVIRDYYSTDIPITVKDRNGRTIYSIDKQRAADNPTLVDNAYLFRVFNTGNLYEAKFKVDVRYVSNNSGVTAIVFTQK